MHYEEFKKAVWQYYAHNARDLPWRVPAPDGNFDAYRILVSELMLQQTQVARVIPKYEQWLDTFPNCASVASASLAQVLHVWSGLGYNRRARYLHQTAQQIVNEYGGIVPREQAKLTTLAGVGKNTAAAIVVYAYNQPAIFIETNIRTVFLHHFFANQTNIADIELLPFIQRTLDTANPRQWYWALMDYGSHLKKSVGNVSVASKHHKKQSTFAGSSRQIRGKVIALLVAGPKTTTMLNTNIDDSRLQNILQTLIKEGLIEKHGHYWSLPK